MASGDEDDRRSERSGDKRDSRSASRSRSRSRSRSPQPERSRSRSGSRRSASPRERSRSRSENGREENKAGGGGGGRKTGTVVRWHPRGFGFIKPDGPGEDVFVHVSAIRDGNALKEDSKVEYDLLYDSFRRKDRADNLTGGFREDKPPPRRDFGGGRDRFEGGGRRDRYDDRGGGRDRYDDRRGRGGYDDRRDRGGYDNRKRSRERYDDREDNRRPRY